MHLKVLSWNLLADCYIHGIIPQNVKNHDSYLKKNVKECESDLNEHLQWKFRFSKICDILADINADICCLQEVDHYEDSISPYFMSAGYNSVFLQRPRKEDGCLIGFKHDKFKLNRRIDIHLDDLACSKSGFERSYLKQNVAVALSLQALDTGISFNVACCHIHWNPRLEELKLKQVDYILHKLHAFKCDSVEMPAPIIFAGDFNSFPSSKVYDMITEQPFYPYRQNVYNLNRVKGRNPYNTENLKFLCEPTLSRLCRWMRVLGIDVAMDSWDTIDAAKEQEEAAKSNSIHSRRASKLSSSIAAFFKRASDEQRVILTSSRGLRERSACPPSFFVRSNDLEKALISIYREFGLELDQERFLTVCGKCGGEITEVDAADLRLMGRILPSDRSIYACVTCAQPYWWNELETSSPAKAMKKAALLYDFIQNGLRGDDEGDGQGQNQDEGSEPHPEAQNLAGSIEAITVESAEALSARFQLREVVLSGDKSSLKRSATDVLPGDFTGAQSQSESFEQGEILPMQLSSVFGSKEQEPELTNWNGNFKGTLDYIFVSDEWKVETATTVPSMRRTIDKRGQMITEYDRYKIDGPLPSEKWPSDHFLITTILRL